MMYLADVVSIMVIHTLGCFTVYNLFVAGDCFTLGRHAYNNNDMYHTVNWMSAALDILDEERNKTADRADVLDYLAYATSLVRVLKYRPLA